MRRVRRACRSLQPQRRRSKHRLWPVTPFEAWTHRRSHRRGGRGASRGRVEQAQDPHARRPARRDHLQIAAKYGIDEYTILAANDLPNANMITVGQKLNILTIPGALHTVKQGESLWEIARTYQTDMNEIIAVNELENPDRIRPRQELVIPGAQRGAYRECDPLRAAGIR